MSGHPSQRTHAEYSRHHMRQQTEEYDSRRKQPANEWVGQYYLNDDGRRGQNLQQLAESNSYTYTLQQPMGRQPGSSAKQEDDYGDESELSAYSPPEEAKGLFTHNNKYGMQPPSEYTQGARSAAFGGGAENPSSYRDTQGISQAPYL